ncbi:MAG: tRNA (adenosine(37)-N6)-dimethylallyltransferase MiaA [Verrucomicrobiota bacterium]|nr:tRNA (adenosine(37)-N6)-dimethylallyltransferase MiaA [Verrucomicrobiota bacterium]
MRGSAAPIEPPFAPVFIAGPTAVGKSSIALVLAELLGGEIISADSMQVYRGLDIGTAKPPAAERRRVPHHLIDVCELRESFDAARFVSLARAAVAEIQARKKFPIFCGGTGLYFQAFLGGLGHAPSPDESLRASLEKTPLPELLAELRERDPSTYERIDRQNPRRVIRAIEVLRLTGKPFSAQRADWKTGNVSTPIYCLTRPAPALRARIAARVDEMFRRGLVEETRRLLERGLEGNQTAMQAIGYRQVVSHLRGGRNLDETIELVKVRTRQFARRQMTWFRRVGNCRWIELEDSQSPQSAALQLKGHIEAGKRGAAGGERISLKSSV